MALPDLTSLLMLCAEEERCRGLIAFGPALRDHAPPAAELGLLLIADDAELNASELPLQDQIASPDPDQPPIRLISCGLAQFASAAHDPAETAWFLHLSEGVVLFDADSSITPLWEAARAWTPARLARARLLRTGELTRFLDAADRAMEEQDWETALRALADGLITQRRLEFLRAQAHPGSSFWGMELPEGIAAGHFHALGTDVTTPEALEGLAEVLALALDVALEESFPTFARLLAPHPMGVAVDTLHFDPLLEDLPHWDLVLWRHHRRGAVEIRAERRELPDLPGHWTTSLMVQLADATSPGDSESS